MTKQPSFRGGPAMARLMHGASMEVMPRTFAKIGRLDSVLAPDRQVFIAHIEGTPIADMVETAGAVRAQGFEPVPHIPARIVPDAATLRDWLARYRDAAGITSVLALAGGVRTPVGAFADSMALLDTGAFDAAGITSVHVAGHPEGNRDIDHDGGEAEVMRAARWKQDFGARTDMPVTLVTQFAFDAAPVLNWAARLAAAGVHLPVRVGVAGPARLQTLIKYGITCGVGPSLGILQRRAKDMTKLLKPLAPDRVLMDLAAHGAGQPGNVIQGVHFFPLGGISATADFIGQTMSVSGQPAA